MTEALSRRGGGGVSATLDSIHTTGSATASFAGRASPHQRQIQSSLNPPFSALPSSLSNSTSRNNSANLDNPSTARRELLDSSFSSHPWQALTDDNPEDQQKKDPLATQVWKLFSKTKSTLPNAERMENLTWRMMAMTLKRKEQAARYVGVSMSDGDFVTQHRPRGADGVPVMVA